ncbi:MAG: hypothetical protein ABIK65_00345 [Candidatus Eisenbacteria bacterium]
MRAWILPSVLLVMCLAPSLPAEEYSVELDLDGVIGNGPDIESALVSDLVYVDVWVFGPGPLFAVGLTICNLDGALEYEGAAGNLPPGWIMTPLLPPGICFDIGAIDISFTSPVALPWLFFTVTYHAAVDDAYGHIIVDLEQSGWMDSGFQSGVFSDFVGAGVRIGATSTDRSSWGSVKSLFR